MKSNLKSTAYKHIYPLKQLGPVLAWINLKSVQNKFTLLYGAQVFSLHFKGRTKGSRSIALNILHANSLLGGIQI